MRLFVAVSLLALLCCYGEITNDHGGGLSRKLEEDSAPIAPLIAIGAGVVMEPVVMDTKAAVEGSTTEQVTETGTSIMGGLLQKILSGLTLVSFVGNCFFLIYAFWLS